MTTSTVTSQWTAGTWRDVLPNGLTLLVQRDPSAPAAAIVTHVRAGFFDEPDEWAGISHVLEHMFFKGTPSRGVGAIAQETKSAGGYLNAGTSYDFTVYYTVLPSRAVASGLEIQADALQHALIDPAELERELKVIIEEAKRKLDSPGAVARETLHEVMYDHHRIRRWRIGREENLARLTREDVWRYYQTRYVPGRTIVTIVGDIDESDILERSRALYGAWTTPPGAVDPSPVEPARSGLRARTMRGEIALAHLVCGWPTVPPLHADATALDLAAGVLSAGRGSWLYRALRESGLASSVSASHFTPTELGMLTIAAELRPERMDEVMGRVAEAIRRLVDEGPAPDDLERVRRLLVMQWSRNFEPTEGRAAALAGAEALLDIHVLDRQFAQLASTSAGQVREAAERYLSLDRLSVLGYLPSGQGGDLDEASLERQFAAAATTPLAIPAPTPPSHFSPAPITSRLEHTVHHAALPGADVLVRQKPGVPLATIGVYAPRPRFDPDGQAGLGALAARALVRGAADLDAAALAFAFERLGGALAPRVAHDWVGFETSVVSDQLGAAAALLDAAIQSPRFDPPDVERERSILLAEAKHVTDDMLRYPFRLAFGAAFGDRGYGLPVSGLEETLETLSAVEVAMWHTAWLDKSRLTVIAVGDFEPARALEILAGVHADWPARTWHPPPLDTAWAAQAGNAVRTEEKPKAQTALAFVFPGPARTHPARYVSDVWAAAAGGLGGRLFEALRDKLALAYTVMATPWQRRGTGTLATYIATSPEREQEAHDAMLKELAGYRDRPAAQSEIRRAVNYLAGQAEVRRQIGGRVVAEIRDAWLMGEGLSEIADPAAPYRAVTADAVHTLAREYLDPERVAIGVVRGTGGGDGR